MDESGVRRFDISRLATRIVMEHKSGLKGFEAEWNQQQAGKNRRIRVADETSVLSTIWLNIVRKLATAEYVKKWIGQRSVVVEFESDEVRNLRYE